MARAPLPALLCCRCGKPGGGRGLVQLAVRGTLAEVCHGCFLLEELGLLTSTLRPGDVVRDLVEEGLQTLYDVARARHAELLSTSVEDGSEGEGGRCREGRS